MKNKFKFLALAIMALLSVNLWGAEATMAYSGSTTNMTGNNDAALVGLSATDWTVVANKGGHNNYPGLNTAGQIRLYGSSSNHNVITVTCEVGTISSIVVTYGNSNYNALVKVGNTTVTGSGSNTEKTYTINNESFSITHNYNATTQVYILSIVITYSSSGGDGAWELVTDASTLKAGDILVIGCSSKGTTAGDISSSIMAKKTSTFNSSGSKITELGEGTVELTLGGTSGAWTFTNSSKKLLGATAVKKVAWGSGTTTWSISISDGKATIQNGTSDYGRFLYNSTSGQERFTTYTSATSASMLLPQLYRKPSTCTAPTITKDLSETEVVYTKNATATALSITATGTDVTYQWYSNTTKSTTGATTLTSQTSSSYTPSTTTTGTKYYYCVASSSTCTTTSKFAKITVNEPSYTITATKNDASLGNVSLSGNVITATPNTCVGYDNSAYTVSPAGKATVAQSGNIFTVSNVTADVTVTINFAELEKDTYVDHLHDNDTIEKCGSYTAPSLNDATKATTGDCDVVHYHFAGWVTNTISTGTSSAPSGMITTGTAMNANGTTYYAVWAKEE